MHQKIKIFSEQAQKTAVYLGKKRSKSFRGKGIVLSLMLFFGGSCSLLETLENSFFPEQDRLVVDISDFGKTSFLLEVEKRNSADLKSEFFYNTTADGKYFSAVENILDQKKQISAAFNPRFYKAQSIDLDSVSDDEGWDDFFEEDSSELLMEEVENLPLEEDQDSLGFKFSAPEFDLTKHPEKVFLFQYFRNVDFSAEILTEDKDPLKGAKVEFVNMETNQILLQGVTDKFGFLYPQRISVPDALSEVLVRVYKPGWKVFNLEKDVFESKVAFVSTLFISLQLEEK